MGQESPGWSAEMTPKEPALGMAEHCMGQNHPPGAPFREVTSHLGADRGKPHMQSASSTERDLMV